jgi:hypothetical protein
MTRFDHSECTLFVCIPEWSEPSLSSKEKEAVTKSALCHHKMADFVTVRVFMLYYSYPDIHGVFVCVSRVLM